MARLRDESKRIRIIDVSKDLFARNGFLGTSISDIVEASGYPVGTIYTYFSSKEEILSTMVEEGWESIYRRLEDCLDETGPAGSKFLRILEDFLPEILRDTSFITILFSEAAGLTRLEEKLDKLTTLINRGIIEAASAGGAPFLDNGFTEIDLKAAITMFFLGILDASRLSGLGAVDISTTDILRSVRKIVELSLGIPLSKPE